MGKTFQCIQRYYDFDCKQNLFEELWLFGLATISVAIKKIVGKIALAR